MTGSERIEAVTKESLVAACEKAKRDGFRLVHITCCKMPDDMLELSYGLDLNFDSLILRLTVGSDVSIPSVTPVFKGSYLYENEIHELYGLDIVGIEPDFRGNFYQVGEKRHFNPAGVASESGLARVRPTIAPIPPNSPNSPAEPNGGKK